EFDGPWAIDEGVAVAHERRRGDADLDAHAMVARFLARIAYGRSRIDGPLPCDGPGAGEYRFQQSCPAALEWADQCDAPRARGTGAVLSHNRLLGLISSLCCVHLIRTFSRVRSRPAYRFRGRGGLASPSIFVLRYSSFDIRPSSRPSERRANDE